MHKERINSYPKLCKFIKKQKVNLSLDRTGLTYESERLLKKKAKDSKDIHDLVVNRTSSQLCLLSSVIGEYSSLFSYRSVFVLPDKKSIDKSTRIVDPYKCLRSYCAAYNVIFSYNPKNPQGLYTRVNYLNKEHFTTFLTPDFPLGKLEPIDGVTMGRLQEQFQDLEDHSTYGIDYLFSKEKGYLFPVHVNMNALAVRLKPKGKEGTEYKSTEEQVILEDFLQIENKEKEKEKGKGNRLLPYIVYLGDEFDSPVFGFGRCFSLNLVDNILYNSNNYGLNGQYTINALYQNTEQRIKRNYRSQPLNRGIVYSTVKFIDHYDKGLSYEEKFFPPTRFIPSVEHFDSTKTSPTLGGKTLQEIEMKDIVRIFPEEELKILKLGIGRALIGTSGSTEYMNPDFIIYSDWRKAIVTVGSPKIGKSTVMEGIMEGFEFLGYKVCPGIDFSERFNLGQSLLSDVSMFDDLTQERLISNLTSHAFKTVVTNGRMTVEDKGKDKEEVRSITTIIGNANDYTSESLYDVDSGAKNRFVALSAHRAPLGEDPWKMCEKVARELNIPKVGIWVRILRECYDTAIEYCSINGEAPKAGISINNIVDNLSLDNRNYFDSEPGITFVVFLLITHGLKQESIEEYVKSIPCDIRDSNIFYSGIETLYEVLSNNDSRERYRSVLEDLWVNCQDRMSIHPYLAMRELRWKSLKTATIEVQQLICNPNFDSEDLSEDNIEVLISLIKNNNGCIRKSYRSIAKDWKQVVSNKFTRDFILKRIVEIKEKFDIMGTETQEKLNTDG